MAIQVLQGEKQIRHLRESVEGRINELLVTDAAVYIEAERSKLTTWLLGLLMSLGQILGITILFGYLKLAHQMTYVPLEQIEAVSVSRTPRAVLITLGLLLLALLYFLGPMLLPSMSLGLPTTLEQALGFDPTLLLIGTVISLILIVLLIVWPRAQIAIFAGGGAHLYSSNKSPAELMSVLAEIQAARQAALRGSAHGV